MVRPLSLDLRQRIANALTAPSKETEKTARFVAKHFSVSVATVVRIGQKIRRGDSLSPRKIGGYRPFLLVGEPADYIRQRLASEPHVSMKILSEELTQMGFPVGHNTVWLFVRREGLSYKKNSVCHRARSSRCSPISGTLEKVSKDN